MIGVIKVYDEGDFTNAFGFFIEIGVAIFIALLLFRYSTFQQYKAADVLKQVSDTTRNLKEISDSLEKQRQQRKEIVMVSVTHALLSVWMTAQQALFVICKNGFKEPDSEDKLSDFVRQSLTDYRGNAERALEQLNNLILLGANDLDVDMVSALLSLHSELKQRISSKSFLFHVAHPWSGTLSFIDQFAKSNFPSLSRNLHLLPDTVQFLPDDIKKSMNIN
jgi:DNA-binding transcriptional MerR regulator